MAPTDETCSCSRTRSTTDGAGQGARRRHPPGRAGGSTDRRAASGGCIHTDLDGAGWGASRGRPAEKQECVPVELAACKKPLTGCSYGRRLGRSDGAPCILGTGDRVLRVQVGRVGGRATDGGRATRGVRMRVSRGLAPGGRRPHVFSFFWPIA